MTAMVGEARTTWAGLAAEPPPPPVPDEVSAYMKKEAEYQAERTRLERRLADAEQSRVQMEQARQVADMRQRAHILVASAAQVVVPNPPDVPSSLGELPSYLAVLHARKAVAEALAAMQGTLAELERPTVVDTGAAQVLVQNIAARYAAFRNAHEALKAADAKLSVDLQRIFAHDKVLVVTGGVSLGSYQAGFLYYYTLRMKQLQAQIARSSAGLGSDFGRFRIASGTSAGSINAFLSLVAGCLQPVINPKDSVFFKTWMNVGLDDLLRNRTHSPVALFSQDAIDEAIGDIDTMLKSAETRWEPFRCDAQLGIAVTRLSPRTVLLGTTDSSGARVPGVDVPVVRQTEKILLRLQREPNGALRFGPLRLPSDRPLVDELFPTIGTPGAQSTSPGDVTVAIDDVMKTLKASAAFPLAFSPVTLDLSTWHKDGPGQYRHTTTPVRLTDGGFLDNAPLHLTTLMVNALPPGTPRTARYLLLSSDAVRWKQPRLAEPREPTGTLLGDFFPFGLQLAAGASDAELLEAVEAQDMANGNGTAREFPGRALPIAGEQLGHFLAFLEEDFRAFDFYQGMADAYDHLNDTLPTSSELASPEFACVLAYRERLRATPPRSQRSAIPRPEDQPQCKNVPAQMRALMLASAWHKFWSERKDDEGDELTAFLDEVRDAGFEYKDFAKLVGKRSPSSMDGAAVRRQLRRLAGNLVQDLAYDQEGIAAGLALGVGGKAALNYFDYRAPHYIGVGVVNGVEGEYGHTLLQGRRTALRLLGGLRLHRLEYRAVETTPAAHRWTINGGVNAALGGEWALSPVFQLEASAGYLVRVLFDLSRGQRIDWRMGPDFGVGATLFQRLYLAAAATFYTDQCAGANVCTRIAGDYRGYSVPFEGRNWDYRISGGVRFLLK